MQKHMTFISKLTCSLLAASFCIPVVADTQNSLANIQAACYKTAQLALKNPKDTEAAQYASICAPNQKLYQSTSTTVDEWNCAYDYVKNGDFIQNAITQCEKQAQNSIIQS